MEERARGLSGDAVCVACDQAPAVSVAKRESGVKLLRGYHDEAERVLYELLVSVSPAESSPFAGAPLTLRVKFPEDYPWRSPTMVAEPAPFHPNVNQETGAVAVRMLESHSMQKLPDDYLALLAAPRLADAVNESAAALYASATEAYSLLSAHSVGLPFPTWSPVTHAAHPQAIRDAICAMLLCVRVREQRAAPFSTDFQWPASQTLPDDVLYRIFSFFARDALRDLCIRYGRPGGGWLGCCAANP